MPDQSGAPPSAAKHEKIAALLRSGATYVQIREVLPVSYGTITAVRKAAGLPERRKSYRQGKPASEAFEDRTQRTEDGHRLWTGHSSHGCSQVLHAGRRDTPRRFAFRLAYGRDPVGYVKAGCGVEECVEPSHQEDRPMREQLLAQLRAIGGDRA
jgi:hypothetical protein